MLVVAQVEGGLGLGMCNWIRPWVGLVFGFIFGFGFGFLLDQGSVWWLVNNKDHKCNFLKTQGCFCPFSEVTHKG